MLLQRLILDDNIGFNYDYMGNANYEYGATSFGRSGIAKAFIDNDIAACEALFSEKHGMSEPAAIKVFVIARKSVITDIQANGLSIRTTHEAFRTTDPGIVAWMRSPWNDREDEHWLQDPLFIVRADLVDAQTRINQFFDPTIKRIKEELNQN